MCFLYSQACMIGSNPLQHNNISDTFFVQFHSFVVSQYIGQ